MDGEFDFSAPQFLESLPEAAHLADLDGADSFFDTPSITETTLKNDITEKFYTPIGKLVEENVQIIKVVDENKENHSTIQNDKRPVKKARRILQNKNDVKIINACREEKQKVDGIEVPATPDKEKEHKMMTRQDKVLKTPILELRARKIIRESNKRKASPAPNDRCFSKRHASQFMSLAEKIMHFQVDTPPRFKTKIPPIEDKRSIHLMPTIPQSPKLITKLRARPHENNTDAEETENHMFKATKLNMKVLEKPSIDRPKPKSPTVQKPFKLTEVVKKEPVKEEVFQFKARPMPRWLSGSCDSLNSSVSSTCSRRSRRRKMDLNSISEDDIISDDDVYRGMSSVTRSNVSTQLKPFSFDERDKEMLKKKEEKIKKLQEEACKIPEFHAAPVPAYISNSSLHNTSKASVLSTSVMSETGSTKDGNKEDTTFKAKFPTVLFKEPFVPQIPERPSVLPAKIELNTEKRARERQEFEKELKKKEERWEQEKKEVMAFLEQKEKEEIAELRKKLVHKAQPVPSFVSNNSETDKNC